MDKVDLNNPYSTRMLNDRIIQIERTFLVAMPNDWPQEEEYNIVGQEPRKRKIGVEPRYVLFSWSVYVHLSLIINIMHMPDKNAKYPFKFESQGTAMQSFLHHRLIPYILTHHYHHPHYLYCWFCQVFFYKQWICRSH